MQVPAKRLGRMVEEGIDEVEQLHDSLIAPQVLVTFQQKSVAGKVVPLRSPRGQG